MLVDSINHIEEKCSKAQEVIFFINKWIISRKEIELSMRPIWLYMVKTSIGLTQIMNMVLT